MAFSQVQLDQYQKDGYLFPIDVLGPAEVAEYRASIEALEAKQGGKLLPSQRPKSHLLFKWLDDLIRDPRVLDPIEELIGPNILCWNTIFWIKDAGSESFVSWHQDDHYWGLDSQKVISVQSEFGSTRLKEVTFYQGNTELVGLGWDISPADFGRRFHDIRKSREQHVN